MLIAFRVDSSLEIGLGHLMRCLTLADQLGQQGVKSLFLCRKLPGNLANLVVERKHELAWIDSDGDDHAATLKALGIRKPSWIAVDHYGLDQNWESVVARHGIKVLAIDDLARVHDCDALLDQTYVTGFQDRYRGKVPARCRLFLGPSHALLRPQFRSQVALKSPEKGRIFIFFGGMDAGNETGKSLQALQELGRADLKSHVVLGGTNPHRDLIRKMARVIPGVQVHEQVENMAELMAISEIALGAGGTTALERCAMALPTIAWSLAPNQDEVLRGLADAGCLLHLGKTEKVSSEQIAERVSRVLSQPEELQKMREACKALMGLAAKLPEDQVVRFLLNPESGVFGNPA